MKFINVRSVSKCQNCGARREVAREMKMLAGSSESWGAGKKCRDSCRSAELEAENSTFLWVLKKH